MFEFAGTAGSTSTFDWLTLTGSSDDSLLGQAVTGRITIETAGLNQIATSTPGFSNLLDYNAALDPLRLVTSDPRVAALADGDTGSQQLDVVHIFDNATTVDGALPRPVGFKQISGRFRR